MLNKIDFKSIIILLIFSFVMGTTLLILNLTSKVDSSFIEKEAVVEKKEGEWDVVSETMEYHIFVRYEFDGKNYLTELTNYSEIMTEGKTITIFVNPNNPEDITALGTASAKSSLVFASIVMYVLSLIASIVLIIKLKVNKKQM